jgi:hypothetical protein
VLLLYFPETYSILSFLALSEECVTYGRLDKRVRDVYFEVKEFFWALLLLVFKWISLFPDVHISYSVANTLMLMRPFCEFYLCQNWQMASSILSSNLKEKVN